MRKLLKAFMVVVCVLCVSLVGCGGSSSNAPASYEAQYLGTWNAVEMSGDMTYNKEQVDAFRALGVIDIYMNLEEGGKATLNTIQGKNSNCVEGTWTADSATQVTLTVNGKSTAITLEGDALSMASEGSTVLFEKVDYREPVSATGASSGNTDSSVTPSTEASTEESAETPSPEASAAEAATPSSGAAESSESSSSSSTAKYEVSIDAADVGSDYEGNPAIIVTFTWKNNSDKTISYASALHAKCFQNGVQLETAFVFDGIDNDGYMSEVRPGYGTTFQMAYELKDTEHPVEVEVGELINLKGELLASKTFEL